MNTITISAGGTRALIAPEAGGRIVQLWIADGGDWLPLLVAPDDLELLLSEPLAWGCYPMTPWPGRVDGSRFTWRGETYELPVNNGSHSIHGRGMYLPWKVAAATERRCELSLEIGPNTGWPFLTRLTHSFATHDDGLSLRQGVHVVGAEGFPAGAGWHPWFRRDVRPEAEPRVRVPASRHCVRRPDLIPTGETVTPAGDADLRSGPALAARRLDDFYGGIGGPMEVFWGDVSLTMTSSANCTHAVVYTESERGFCVEPQSCAPDAFNLDARGIPDTGLTVVEPGRPLVVDSRWRWRIGG